MTLAEVMPRKKVVFETVAQAREALRNDKLGVVYRRATEIYVVTAYGSGRFLPKDWDAPVVQ